MLMDEHAVKVVSKFPNQMIQVVVLLVMVMFVVVVFVLMHVTIQQ
jgi:hypothetical protein